MSTPPAEASGDPARTAVNDLDGRTVDRSGRLSRPSWMFVIRTATGGFFRDQCIDLAAGLSFRMLL